MGLRWSTGSRSITADLPQNSAELPQKDPIALEQVSNKERTLEATTKNFNLYTILAVTHRLPSDLSPYVDILSWMVGKTVNQFEWISAHPVCGEALAEQHPQLRDIPAAPDFDGDERRMDAWADEQKARIGASSLPVAQLSPEKRDEALSVDAVAEHITLNKVWHLDLNKPYLGLDKPTD